MHIIFIGIVFNLNNKITTFTEKHASINQNEINILIQFPITDVFKYEND